MTAALVASVLAPVYGSPDHRAELTSEALLGQVLDVLDERPPFLWVRGEDEHAGWVHCGHLLAGSASLVDAWREEASAISLGAVLALGGHRLLLPLGARVAPLHGGAVRLPDGRVAQVAGGRVAAESDLLDEARQLDAATWAEVFFAGAPYRWGGVTPWGVDCSGLVQAVFRCRGVHLPRDAAAQARCGAPLAGPDPLAAGAEDLLFFRETAGADGGDRIAHVAIADGTGYVVHSSAATGGVCRSPLGGGSEEARRLRGSFTGARRVVHQDRAAPPGRSR